LNHVELHKSIDRCNQPINQSFYNVRVRHGGLITKLLRNGIKYKFLIKIPNVKKQLLHKCVLWKK